MMVKKKKEIEQANLDRLKKQVPTYRGRQPTFHITFKNQEMY
jgi:hypothetical protein